MRDTNLVNTLREHAEWARANEWETPITLGDDLTEAADRIVAAEEYALGLKKEIEKLRGQVPRWIPVTERLPENAKHPGALCPVYLVATKYGITEGWYNPDARGWFIIVKRLTGLYDGECDINFKSGDVVRVEYAKNGIVTHWMPMPEPPKEVE